MRLFKRFLVLFSALFSFGIAQAGVAVGNPQGPVTVIEYFDYQCPHCKHMAPIMENIINTTPYLRVEYRDFPIIDGTSTYAALAGLASKYQGKYNAYHNALLNATIPLTNAKVIATAAKIGLNLPQLEQDIRRPVVAHELEQEVAQAKKMNLISTPAFIIQTSAKDNKPIVILGTTTQQNLMAAIQSKYAESKKQ